MNTAPSRSVRFGLIGYGAWGTFQARAMLIRHVAETLIPVHPTAPSRRLMYGEFAGPGMATEADFRVAEWQPSERELDGA